MVKILLLTLLGFYPFALGKGGKGGGSSSSDSDSSGGDGGGSSSSSSRPKGVQHVEVSGNNWPYRWAGSYYNGSITLETSIEYWPGCSERSRDVWRTNMDGILHLGPGNWTGTYDDEEPQFLLMGWEDGTIPTNNWTDGIYWGNGGPGLTRWFSTDVQLMLSRHIQIWHEKTEFTASESPRPYDHGWKVETSPLGNGTNEYSINGTWSGTALTFQPSDNAPNNFMRPVTTLCNNASIIDTFIMQPYVYKSAVRDWPTRQNTTFRGTFSSTRASIAWGGNYWAGFQSINYGVPGDKDGYPQGYFEVTFEGEVDQSKSDTLIPRARDEGTFQRNVGGPDWVALLDRENNVPEKRIYYSGGVRVTRKGGLWISLAALVALFVL